MRPLARENYRKQERVSLKRAVSGPVLADRIAFRESEMIPLLLSLL